MVKCCATGVHGKSDEFYKIGCNWYLTMLGNRLQLETAHEYIFFE